MTAFLLDTHVVLWAAGRPDRLPPTLRRALDDPDGPVLVSAVSIAEMTIKQALGKLTLPLGPIALCEEFGFEPLALRWEHAARVETLPPLHRDPFDRLLLASALVDDLTLVTADAAVLAYPDVSFYPL